MSAAPLIHFSTPNEIHRNLRFRQRMFSQAGNLDLASADIDACFDASPNCIILGVEEGRRVVAAMRIHVMDRGVRQSPAYQVFPDIIDPELERGFRVVDSSGFCVEAATIGDRNHLASRLIAASIHVARRVAPSKLIATARDRHGAFYRRVLGGDLACPGRPYPGRRRPLALYIQDCGRVSQLLQGRSKRAFWLNDQDRETVDGALDAKLGLMERNA